MCYTRIVKFLTFMVLCLPGVALGDVSGLEEVSAGDAALFSGDRRVARQHFLAAAASGDPAAEAMARLRLLSSSGNLGAVVHGPKIDRALSETTGPWGLLAWADYHRLAPAAVGARPEEGVALAREALGALPGPAAARLFLLTGDTQWLARLAVADAPDGLGDGLLVHRALPKDPGTWYVGLGIGGAPGQGVGGSVFFRHPDLFLRRWFLSTGAWGNSHGNHGGSLYLSGPGRLSPRITAQASRQDFYDYLDTETIVMPIGNVRLAGGPQVRVGGIRYGVQGIARWDAVGSQVFRGHGVGGDLAWDTREGGGKERRGHLALLAVEGTFLDYSHASLVVDLRWFRPVWGSVLAVRGLHQQAFSDAPRWRLPAVGGATTHRGAWHDRHRAGWVDTLDVEGRRMVTQRLEAVVFGNMAAVLPEGPNAPIGLFPGGGVGLRLLLPPEEWNLLRIDLATSTTNDWVVTGGWGEAF
jgi:hypothetical protein